MTYILFMIMYNYKQEKQIVKKKNRDRLKIKSALFLYHK